MVGGEEMEVWSLRRCGCADKAASRGEGNYFVTDYNWTTSDAVRFRFSPLDGAI